MRQSFHDTRTGAEVDEHTALDARGCIRDGFTMRIKLMLMDGVPVATDHVPLTNKEKLDQIDRRNAELSNAWRNPPPTPAMTAVRADDEDTGDVYERRDRRLRDAWKHPA